MLIKMSNFTLFIALIFLGIGNALPIPLIGSNLSIWLTEAGFEKNVIGLFALLGIPFSLKILWSPIIDRFTLPFFKQSPRKGWVFFALTGMACTLLFISTLQPAETPWLLAGAIVIMTVFKACLYIAGLSYELESLEKTSYGMGSACILSGYRVGLLAAGSGALYISYLINWSIAFQCMAALLVVGALIVLLQPEPFQSRLILAEKQKQFALYPSMFRCFWNETILQPCRSFFKHVNWKMILLLIFSFKIGDHMSKSMEGPFYLFLGFNKAELAAASKLWGMAATISGAFIAGMFVRKKDSFVSLVVFGMIHACSLLCYYLMAVVGKSMIFLCLTVAVEHFTSGMAMTAFIYFLWSICDKKYAAVQYALFWSFFTIKADLFASLGGYLASNYDWHVFFIIVSSVGITSSFFACKAVIQSKHKDHLIFNH